AVVLEVTDRDVQRVLEPLLLVREVADRRAFRDTARRFDRAGRREQRLDQRRLARSGVADERDVADIGRIVGPVRLRHGTPPRVRLVVPPRTSPVGPILPTSRGIGTTSGPARPYRPVRRRARPRRARGAGGGDPRLYSIAPVSGGASREGLV